MSKEWKERLFRFGNNLALSIIFVVFLFPIYWVGTLSLKKSSDILTWPPKFIFSPTLENFKDLLFGGGGGVASVTVNFLQYFKNSLIISVGALLLSLLVGIPAAYAIARWDFTGKEDIAFTFLTFRFAPPLMVIIPIFVIFQRLNLLNTYIGLIWVYQLITLPMIIWILRGYFEDISTELEEAALVDGYPQWRAFWDILIPLVRPGIAASSLLAFIYAWNNFIFALILGGGDVKPITVGAMQFMTAESVQYGSMAAATILAAIPAFILAIYSQKHLIAGLSLGAVKE